MNTCFIHIWFNLQNDFLKWVVVLISIYIWRNWDLEGIKKTLHCIKMQVYQDQVMVARFKSRSEFPISICDSYLLTWPKHCNLGSPCPTNHLTSILTYLPKCVSMKSQHIRSLKQIVIWLAIQVFPCFYSYNSR